MFSLARWPMWARISAALLLTCLIGGQVWQRRPAGEVTKMIVTLAMRHCPAAVRLTSAATIGDGAWVLNRWSYRVLAGTVDVDGNNRCRAAETKKGGELEKAG